jgi:hypothetical protein
MGNTMSESESVRVQHRLEFEGAQLVEAASDALVHPGVAEETLQSLVELRGEDTELGQDMFVSASERCPLDREVEHDEFVFSHVVSVLSSPDVEVAGMAARRLARPLRSSHLE